LYGPPGVGAISREILIRNAREEVARNAGLMMETALAVRGYTITQVRPHLEMQLIRAFLPQTVPAFAAAETMGELRKKYPDYFYKEATLNPTNPRNRAADWEADLVLAFQRDPGQTYLTGERATPRGSSLYIAAPIRITNKDCLQCHSTPEIAPAAMVARYGKSNGFSWKLNEVVGAQVVSVPMTVPLANANRAFITFIASLCAVFVVLYIALNVMLSTMIVRPIAQMSAAADQVSMGDFTTPEFRMAGKGEIGRLATSFNRMRRSLQQAMKMIEPDDGAT
jgi:protein-histidine pros-kinase